MARWWYSVKLNRVSQYLLLQLNAPVATEDEATLAARASGPPGWMLQIPEYTPTQSPCHHRNSVLCGQTHTDSCYMRLTTENPPSRSYRRFNPVSCRIQPVSHHGQEAPIAWETMTRGTQAVYNGSGKVFGSLNTIRSAKDAPRHPKGTLYSTWDPRSKKWVADSE
jgi:hypothetical protein